MLFVACNRADVITFTVIMHQENQLSLLLPTLYLPVCCPDCESLFSVSTPIIMITSIIRRSCFQRCEGEFALSVALRMTVTARIIALRMTMKMNDIGYQMLTLIMIEELS